MKTSSPSAYTSSSIRSGRSKIANGLAIAVLSLGLALSAGAQADQGFTEKDNRVRGNPRPRSRFWNIRISPVGIAKNFSRKPGRSCSPNTLTPAKCAWCIVISRGPPAVRAWIPPWRHDARENRDSIGRCTTVYFQAATNFRRHNSGSRLKISSSMPSNLAHASRHHAIPRTFLKIGWRRANWVSGAPRILFCTSRMNHKKPS